MYYSTNLNWCLCGIHPKLKSALGKLWILHYKNHPIPLQLVSSSQLWYGSCFSVSSPSVVYEVSRNKSLAPKIWLHFLNMASSENNMRCHWLIIISGLRFMWCLNTSEINGMRPSETEAWQWQVQGFHYYWPRRSDIILLRVLCLCCTRTVVPNYFLPPHHPTLR